MELDQRMEDFLYERERKIQERSTPRQSPPASKPRDPVEEITSELNQAIRTQAGVKELFARVRKEQPHLDEWLKEWEAKILWDLMERKWS
jgi:hypothetical protein